MMDTLEILGNFRRSIEPWYIPVEPIAYLVIGAKPFPANQNVTYECFRCLQNIPYILPVVYLYEI